jgi:hemolysin III
MSLVIYALMGWAVIFAIKPLLGHIQLAGFILLAAGGLLYTFGIVFYAFDSRFKHWHGIWHLFVVGGSLAHYCSIAFYVL